MPASEHKIITGTSILDVETAIDKHSLQGFEIVSFNVNSAHGIVFNVLMRKPLASTAATTAAEKRLRGH